MNIGEDKQNIESKIVNIFLLFNFDKDLHNGAPCLWRWAWQCYMMLVSICIESLVLGCNGIMYFLIPPPSFTSPLEALCCATHLLWCLQQPVLGFTQISSVVVAASFSTAGTSALKTSWNRLRVWGSLSFHTYGCGLNICSCSYFNSHKQEN